MQSKASTVEDYLNELSEERREAVKQLREVILKHIPKGFKEGMSYGMIGYAVPHSLFPKGYHCDPKLPLPFMSLASQKNFIAVYHMGIYANKELLEWFVAAYPKHCKTKLDMGKGCVRFKKLTDIPYALIGKLAEKMTAEEWIEIYEKNISK